MLWWLLGSKVFLNVRKKKNIYIYVCCTYVYKCTPISGQAFVTETLDLGSIPCLAFSNEKEQCKDLTSQYELDRWKSGSLSRRPKGFFAVSWPKQLGE